MLSFCEQHHTSYNAVQNNDVKQLIMAQNNDIHIYGAIRAMTGEGKSAYADQIWDEALGKFQSELNQQFSRASGGDAESIQKINDNSTSIETKVNALMAAVRHLITYVVYHSGVPYNIPTALQTDLSLERLSSSGSTPAVCGRAICGQTICGVI